MFKCCAISAVPFVLLAVLPTASFAATDDRSLSGSSTTAPVGVCAAYYNQSTGVISAMATYFSNPNPQSRRAPWDIANNIEINNDFKTPPPDTCDTVTLNRYALANGLFGITLMMESPQHIDALELTTALDNLVTATTTYLGYFRHDHRHDLDPYENIGINAVLFEFAVRQLVGLYETGHVQLDFCETRHVESAVKYNSFAEAFLRYWAKDNRTVPVCN
jgi:hypothetical protein